MIIAIRPVPLSMATPASGGTPATSPPSAPRVNIWRSAPRQQANGSACARVARLVAGWLPTAAGIGMNSSPKPCSATTSATRSGRPL